MKICKRCNSSEVYSNKAHYCQDCRILVDREKTNKYYHGNREKCIELTKEYKENNKDHIREYSKNYQAENKSKLNENRRDHRDIHKDQINLYQREWREKNREHTRTYHRSYSIVYNSRYSWRKAWRTILSNTLKRFGTDKMDKTINMLGYSSMDLKIHIESKFIEGMSWENYGEWHIDHIKPVSSFDISTPMYIVNGLDNLQPLWKFDNLSKGKKMSFNI